ncbi:AbrB/MazE/SpoVT family DNA-binding domain-containing protein [Candidatus Woesearchaeota archaeon]|nr:AbrB/MazE/SpoVT family DNA-binding domain-containing protein [Candidatus Woesearchaeota archaeon]
MRRKVIQIGDSTQLISLPRKWALKHGIKKGDEMEIKEEGNHLVIASDIESRKKMDIEIKVDGLDKDSLIFLLRGLYIKGYHQIKFTWQNPYVTYHRFGEQTTISSIIHKEVRICHGLDIIQEKKDSFTLKNISISSVDEFDNILKRIFLLLMDTSNDLFIGVKNNDYLLLDSFQDRHDNITRLLNYNLKILNTMGYSDNNQTNFLFHIISSIDFIIDMLKNTARDISKNKLKLSNKAVKIIDWISKDLKSFHELYYNFDLKKAEKFVKERQEVLDTLQNSINDFSKNEIRILVMTEQLLEVLRDIYPARMAMEY